MWTFHDFTAFHSQVQTFSTRAEIKITWCWILRATKPHLKLVWLLPFLSFQPRLIGTVISPRAFDSLQTWDIVLSTYRRRVQIAYIKPPPLSHLDFSKGHVFLPCIYRRKKTVSLPKVHRWCNQNVWVVHLSLRWPGTHAGRYGAPGCSTYEGMQLPSLHQNLVLRDAEQPRWTKMDIFDRRTFAYIFWVVQIGEQLHTLLFYLILIVFFWVKLLSRWKGF